jgi:hypothetical protein
MNEEQLLSTGKLEPIANIAERVTGERPSRQTEWRWIHKGCCGGIKLPCRHILNKWRTTEAAFRAWLAARSQAMLAASSANAPAASDDDLRAAGLL